MNLKRANSQFLHEQHQDPKFDQESHTRAQKTRQINEFKRAEAYILLGIFRIRSKRRGDPTRIREHRNEERNQTHESEEAEDDGVEESRRGIETQPLIQEHEHCRVVDVAN